MTYFLGNLRVCSQNNSLVNPLHPKSGKSTVQEDQEPAWLPFSRSQCNWQWKLSRLPVCAAGNATSPNFYFQILSLPHGMIAFLPCGRNFGGSNKSPIYFVLCPCPSLVRTAHPDFTFRRPLNHESGGSFHPRDLHSNFRVPLTPYPAEDSLICSAWAFWAPSVWVRHPKEN
jgi:hypothetical protein